MSKKSKKNVIIITVVLVLVLIAGLFIFFNSRKNKIENMISNFTVKTETYENIIEVSGNISAAQSQQLQAAGSGTVKNVYVKEGDFVKKGDIILELDSTEQEYNLATLDYEIAQKKINGSSRELELLSVKRDMYVQKLKDRKITAYFDGIIASLNVAKGDYLSAKDSVGTLIDRSYMTASVEVVETDVSKLAPGQIVHFNFPAYKDETVDGYVVSYPAIGTVTQRGATVVNAQVRIDNPPASILPNYSFTGKIQITEPETVTLVDKRAIGYEKGKPYADVVSGDGSVNRVDVKVLPYDKKYLIVESGLKEGDVVKNLNPGFSGAMKNGSQR